MSLPARNLGLRLVANNEERKQEPFNSELCLSFTEEVHSLHQAVPSVEHFPAALAELIISKYSNKGEVVLDSSCGNGTVPFQAALMGRVAFAADVNPIYLRALSAKLDPADLAEVTLRLSSLDLRRPVDLTLFNKGFREFYESETFRDVSNLKAALLQARKNSTLDRGLRFIEMVSLGLLHGHSAGFFSAYTFPQVSLSIEAQTQLNIKRKQAPEYRAVMPRILRRTAGILRDGLPSAMLQLKRSHRLAEAVPSNVSFVPTGSVALVCTAPALPEQSDGLDELWLRSWFSGIQFAQLRESARSSTAYGHQLSYAEWVDYCNGLLLEAARVLRSGGICAIKVREKRLKSYIAAKPDSSTTPQGTVVELDREIVNIIERDFPKFFSVEGRMLVRPEAGVLAMSSRDGKGADISERVVILKRK